MQAQIRLHLKRSQFLRKDVCIAIIQVVVFQLCAEFNELK